VRAAAVGVGEGAGPEVPGALGDADVLEVRRALDLDLVDARDDGRVVEVVKPGMKQPRGVSLLSWIWMKLASPRMIVVWPPKLGFASWMFT
jgi:hypothetical protein